MTQLSLKVGETRGIMIISHMNENVSIKKQIDMTGMQSIYAAHLDPTSKRYCTTDS